MRCPFPVCNELGGCDRTLFVGQHAARFDERRRAAYVFLQRRTRSGGVAGLDGREQGRVATRRNAAAQAVLAVAQIEVEHRADAQPQAFDDGHQGRHAGRAVHREMQLRIGDDRSVDVRRAAPALAPKGRFEAAHGLEPGAATLQCRALGGEAFDGLANGCQLSEPTLTTRFTFPRGSGSNRGIGLNEHQIDDVVDFIENGLYDPAFVHYDPKSTTRVFQLSPPDIVYSIYRPDLAALGAEDGQTLSGKAQDNDDPLSRRDMGLEFLDVTDRVKVAMIASSVRDDEDDDDNGNGPGGDAHKDGRQDRHGGEEQRTYRLTNASNGLVDTHLLVIANGLPFQVEMTNASGRTSNGFPYQRLFLPNGVLEPGQSIDVTLRFKRYRQSPPVNFTLTLLSGQGKP